MAYFVKTNPSQEALGAQLPVFQNSLGDKKVLRYYSLFIALLVYLFDATEAYCPLKGTGCMSSV